MSWGINIVGKGADLKRETLKGGDMPQPAKDAISLLCDDAPHQRFHLETSGHFHPGVGWNTFYLRIVPAPNEAACESIDSTVGMAQAVPEAAAQTDTAAAPTTA